MEDVRRNLIKFEIGSSKRKKKIKSSLWNLFSRILNLPAYKKKKKVENIYLISSGLMYPNFVVIFFLTSLSSKLKITLFYYSSLDLSKDSNVVKTISDSAKKL